VKDGQANHEDADAGEDLRTAMGGLGANLAGGRKKENDAERELPVIEPISLGLLDRGHKRDAGNYVNGPYRLGNNGHGYHGDDPERSADGLLPYALTFAPANGCPLRLLETSTGLTIVSVGRLPRRRR
jgi:hypothetical protein